MIKQVLLNLLSNAVKFTDRGGTITVHCGLLNDGGIIVSVTDTGIGIKEDDIPKALSTFGQVDGSIDRKFEGTGLGLPLAKSLTELHGGTFMIESKFGKGTTVSFTLPDERVMQKKPAPL